MHGFLFLSCLSGRTSSARHELVAALRLPQTAAQAEASRNRSRGEGQESGIPTCPFEGSNISGFVIVCLSKHVKGTLECVGHVSTFGPSLIDFLVGEVLYRTQLYVCEKS